MRLGGDAWDFLHGKGQSNQLRSLPLGKNSGDCLVVVNGLRRQQALMRDRNKRYQSAFAMLTDLEMYLYSDGYGPTNEKLGVYLKELFGITDPGGTSVSSRHPYPTPLR